VYVCSLDARSPADDCKSNEKWAVLSSIFTPTDSRALIPQLPSPGNVGCPSSLNLSSEQWAFSVLSASMRVDILQERVYVTPIRFQKRSFWQLFFSPTVHKDLAVAWSTQLVFDTFIFLLTLMRSLHIRKERSRSIVEIILRDGVSFELGLLLKLKLMGC